MAEGDRLGQRHVERQVAGDRRTDLIDLQRMSEPGDEVVALRVHEHLGLVLEAPESLGVNDPIPVTLERSPVIGFILRVKATLSSSAL